MPYRRLPNTDKARIITNPILKATTSGLIILSIDDFNNSNPTNIIRNDTINDATYSILPCPNGWSLSGF